VFPDYPAPVVRNAGSEREIAMMRWGMPPPPRTGGPPVTNKRVVDVFFDNPDLAHFHSLFVDTSKQNHRKFNAGDKESPSSTKLPYNVTRGAHSRKPRRSKNGTPQERAAKISAVAEAAANVIQLPRPASSVLEKEFSARIAMLDESGRQYITGYMQALLDQRGKQ